MKIAKALCVMMGMLALTFAPSGCARRAKVEPEPAAQAIPEPPAESEQAARVQELGKLSGELSQQVNALPGHGESQHRQRVARTLELLGQVLSTLQGPRPDGGFRQQLMILDGTRQQLSGASPDLAVEPTIDTALRAAYGAMSGIYRRSFFDQEKIGQTLDAVRFKMDRLDAVRGPLHRVAVAEVAQVMAAAVEQMSATLSERLTAKLAAQPDAPAEQAPADETPAQEAPGEVESTEETPSDEAPAEMEPEQEAPAEDAPAEDAPAEMEPTEEAPAEDAPAEDAPAEEAPVEMEPEEEAPAEDAPADDAATEDAPVEG